MMRKLLMQVGEEGSRMIAAAPVQIKRLSHRARGSVHSTNRGAQWRYPVAKLFSFPGVRVPQFSDVSGLSASRLPAIYLRESQ
jgi:hypothetical protein